MGQIIDISKWNAGSIKWDVLGPQLDLCICRVQYGSNMIDQYYNGYVKELEKRNIPHAAYAYGCFVSVNDAIKEADDFMARVSPNAKFLVLDTEDDTLKSCGEQKIAEASQAFINRCKSKGWKVGFYVSHHMYNKYGLNNVKADFLWIPRYGGPKPAYKCDIWQYADGETGGWLDGIGKVDLNSLVGDKPLSWFIGNKQQDQTVSNDGYQFVKSYEFGTNLIGEAIKAMNERGTKGKVVVNPLTGLAYIETEVLPNPELDKITWWMDTRPDGKWYYEYIKK
ncbi:N-acetylmuramoyl-L-alanine amidase C-terminal domain-containing protein [Bacillus mycoides]|uniref:N-acetylmuramoyl-L-alanine amidase C-terminal domain-containing protein n=1 Tax=Bacillus mycoides TaxID=1405 RepID=UPI00292D843D|nr:N-acetylmuramoyl-L-alanine amidase C-terminal domain-containing protein [Bacillus mycoides]WOA56394.1 N-acetylmuramoyl-L-alanine amidase C-terminal domain-containing protein [Bacillus mycoides]